jgi:hypothetical protein
VKWASEGGSNPSTGANENHEEMTMAEALRLTQELTPITCVTCGMLFADTDPLTRWPADHAVEMERRLRDGRSAEQASGDGGVKT